MFGRMADDGLHFTCNLTVGVTSEIGCLRRVDEVVQNGHAWNNQQCSYQMAITPNVRLGVEGGASSRAEETRVKTKTASVQSGSGDKFKETRKAVKECEAETVRGGGLLSNRAPRKKKKRHILLRELTSWTPKLH